MNNEIIVRKYTDLKTFFENKALQNQITLNMNFLKICDSYKKQIDLSDKVLDTASKVSNAANYINQATSGKSKLEAILSPEMEEALKNGTAKLCSSHKDGEIFSKIQYHLKARIFAQMLKSERIYGYSNQ